MRDDVIEGRWIGSGRLGELCASILAGATAMNILAGVVAWILLGSWDGWPMALAYSAGACASAMLCVSLAMDLVVFVRLRRRPAD